MAGRGSKSTKPKRVLVLEDDDSMIPIIKGVLLAIDRNMQIETATSADQVIEALDRGEEQAHQFDLIIADVLLEGEATGYDLWQIFHDNFPTVQVLLISGIPYEKFMATMVKRPPTPLYLAKPFAPGKLMDVVKRLLK